MLSPEELKKLLEGTQVLTNVNNFQTYTTSTGKTAELFPIDETMTNTVVRWALKLPDGRLMRVGGLPKAKVLLNYAALYQAEIIELKYAASYELIDQKPANIAELRKATW